MIKRTLSLILCFVMIFGVLAVNVATASSEETTYSNETFLERVKKDYKLVWSDEFNGNTLDTTKWQFDGDARRNSELQYYTSTMEDGNLQFDGENAVIVPKIEERIADDGRKFKYTSAEISTQGKYAWKYGYFEIRAKASIGKNLVPAIWTMGYDYNYGSCDWPYSGEIDIIERKGDDSVYSTLHHSSYKQKNHVATGAGGQSFDHKLNEQYHNYWLFWTDKYLVIGVDDAMHRIVDITTPDLSQSFRTYEHWLLLNVALGMFANPVNDEEEELWKMWIDYVRVYQLEEDEFYDDYLAFSVLDLKHNGSEYAYGGTVSTLKGNSDLTFTMQDELKPGKYDVYAEIKNANINCFVNGVKTNEISTVDHGVNVGHQAFVGSVDLQDQSDFDITLKAKDGSGITIEKLLFVKTDENKNTPVVVNKDNCVETSDCIEVSTQDELISAFKHLNEKGTIKLSNDITISQRIYTYNEPTIDLNGHTITVNGGYFAVADENKPTTVKNGNVVTGGSSNNFINTKENNYGAQAKLENVNVTINTSASYNYVFSHNYASINSQCDNCTFTFGEKISNASVSRISRGNAIYNNCTFSFNNKGDKGAFLIGKDQKLYFNSCVINDAKTLFYSDSALASADVKFSNTTINNLTALSNFTENAQFVSIEINNVIKQNGEEVSISADMTGNFTMECNHSYLDANCTTPKHCEYCYISEGEALGHSLSTETTQPDCVYAGSVKTYCTACSTVFSEKTIPVTAHNYQFVETIEPSCSKNGYHNWACSECGMKQQRSYNGDGKIIKSAHTPDESRKTVIKPSCLKYGYTQNYCIDCGASFKKDRKVPTGHDCEEIVDYEAGTITYDCKDCDYIKTVPLDTCKHTPVEGSGVVTEPTCQAKGYTEYTCSVCNKKYKDDYKDKLSSCVATEGKDVVVEATCGEDGYTEHTCKFCGDKFKTDIVSATGNHTPDPEKDNVVEATCKKGGYTEHYCTVCEKTYKTDETPINPEAHKEFVVSGYESTCTETGLTSGSGCEICGTVFEEPQEIPKLQHTEVSDLGKFATCSEEGLTMGSHCSVCGETIVAQETIPKLPHTEQTQAGYAPTCAKTGLTDKVYCVICGETVIEAEVIPTVSHKFTVKDEKKATYTAKGYTGDIACSMCGEIKEAGKVIPRKTLKKPTIKLSKKGNKLTVTIKKVTGAKKYEVYIKIGKKWKKFTTKKLKFTKKLTKGKKYQVKVRAIAGTNKSKYSKILPIKL